MGEFAPEKPSNGESQANGVRAGVRKFCDNQLQAWLDDCPVELSDSIREAIETLAASCRNASAEVDLDADD